MSLCLPLDCHSKPRRSHPLPIGQTTEVHHKSLFTDNDDSLLPYGFRCKSPERQIRPFVIFAVVWTTGEIVSSCIIFFATPNQTVDHRCSKCIFQCDIVQSIAAVGMGNGIGATPKHRLISKRDPDHQNKRKSLLMITYSIDHMNTGESLGEVLFIGAHIDIAVGFVTHGRFKCFVKGSAILHLSTKYRKEMLLFPPVIRRTSYDWFERKRPRLMYWYS